MSKTIRLLCLTAAVAVVCSAGFTAGFNTSGPFIEPEDLIGTASPESQVGSAFRISQADFADETVADVVYDFNNNRFLVLWEVDPPLGNGIGAALYNADGTLFRAPFLIYSVGTFSARPRGSYDATFGYMVVWEDTTIIGGRDILARQVSAAGLLGNVVNMSQLNTAIQSKPDVAVTGPNSFMVVWQDERLGKSEVYGQPVINSLLFGNNIRMTTDPAAVPNTAPSIAPGLFGHTFLIWERQVGANVDIYGGVLDDLGRGQLGPIPLGFGPAQQIAPAIAFAPEHSQYFAVWESNVLGLGYQIEGAFINVNFNNYAFTVVPGVVFSAIVPEIEPDVAYDDANDQYLVVWAHQRPLSVPEDWDILGGFIGANGAFGPAEDVAIIDTTSQLVPSVAFGTARDEFLVAWHDNANVQLDIYGQRIKYELPELTVTSPNGGESWAVDTTHEITWTSNFSELTTVTIELERGGATDLTIIESTENDGSFDWTIPSGQEVATDYRIRISTIAQIVTDVSDADFSIVSTAPQGLEISSPNGGETWQRGTQRTITWVTGDNCATVRLELYKGGSLDSTIIASTDNDGSYDWTIPAGQAVGTDYRVRVTCTTDAANTDQSDANFSITDVAVAEITVTAPNGGESWQQSSTNAIRWTSSGPVGTNVNIALYKGGSFNSTIATGTANDGQFSWTVPAGQTAGTDYRVRVTDASDAAVFDESNANFSITTSSGDVNPRILVPNGGETLVRGTVTQISWLPGQAGQTVTIDLIRGSTLYQNIVPVTANSGLYNWMILPSVPVATNYRIRIASTTQPGLVDLSDSVFSIIGVSNLRVLVPNGGESWRATETREIRWVADGGQTVQIELLKGGSLDHVIVSTTPNDGSYLWSIPAAQTPGTDYRVRVFSTTDPSADDQSDNNFSIGAPPKPDLTAEAFDFSPQDVIGGGAIQFSGRVVNQGDGTAADSFWVEFRVSPNPDFSEPRSFLCDSALVTGPLAPGGSFNLSTLSRTVYTQAQGLAEGVYYVGVVVDAANGIDEVTKSNNTIWTSPKKIYVGPRPSRAIRWSLYR